VPTPKLELFFCHTLNDLKHQNFIQYTILSVIGINFLYEMRIPVKVGHQFRFNLGH